MLLVSEDLLYSLLQSISLEGMSCPQSPMTQYLLMSLFHGVQVQTPL